MNASPTCTFVALFCFLNGGSQVSTTNGSELARVTVVDTNKEIVLDDFVLPEHRVLDYNTEFSGITEATLRHITRRLSDVQRKLLALFDADTVLVGHSLESDLHALKVRDVRFALRVMERMESLGGDLLLLLTVRAHFIS